MRAGELKHRVIIQRETETLDNYNTPTVGWQNIATIWAAVDPLSGQESLQTKNTSPELSVRIRIRYRPGLNNGMRVLYGARIFNIESIMDIEERHVEMHLMCSEVFLK